MEYYLFLTDRCNISCSYCSAGRVVSRKDGRLFPKERFPELVEFIKRNRKYQKNGSGEDIVIFFGGEPLLEWQLIEEFFKSAEGLDVRYGLYTNGLLLKSVPVDVLNSLDVLFVSFDGDKNSHEKHRGRGTYDRIIDNLKELRGRLRCTVLGRITVEEETDLFSSVTNILGTFVDAVYWQIVNKPRFNDPQGFIRRYREGAERLFRMWIERLGEGQTLKIIPIQAIVASLLFGYNGDVSFRCGAGSVHRTIDVDGNIYWCDEYVGDERGRIGHITDSVPPLDVFVHHTALFEDCKDCDVAPICLGRCRKALTEYSTEQKRLYCAMTRYLINFVREGIGEIKEVVDQRGYRLEDIYQGPYWTEEIP